MRTILVAAILALAAGMTANAADPTESVIAHNRASFVKLCQNTSTDKTGFKCHFNRDSGASGMSILWVDPPSKNADTAPTARDKEKIYEFDRLAVLYRKLGGQFFTVRHAKWSKDKVRECTFARDSFQYVCNDRTVNAEK